MSNLEIALLKMLQCLIENRTLIQNSSRAFASDENKMRETDFKSLFNWSEDLQSFYKMKLLLSLVACCLLVALANGMRHYFSQYLLVTTFIHILQQKIRSDSFFKYP